VVHGMGLPLMADNAAIWAGSQPKVRESPVMAVKELDRFTQVHTSVDTTGDNGDKQFASNGVGLIGVVKGVDFGTTFSSLISHAKNCLALS